MGKILIYDDEEKIVKQIKSSVRKIEGLTPIVFTTLKSLQDYMNSEDNWYDVKAVIFDLAQKKEEDEGIMEFEILEDVERCYKNRRVPIFIHSAYADEIEQLTEYPTVLLFKKGARSIRNVKNTLALFENTGFLDLFCEGPLLKDEVARLENRLEWGEDSLKKILHQGFIESFSGSNILEDLEAISKGEDVKRKTFQKYLKPTIDKLKEL